MGVPGCAGYGDTGSVRRGGWDAEGGERVEERVDRRMRSERWRAESTEETGLKVGVAGVPEMMKEPEIPGKTVFEVGVDARTRG